MGALAVLSLLAVLSTQLFPCALGSGALLRKLDEQPFEPGAECPSTCAEIYSPVCGTDGVQALTFGNKCEFKVANCRGGKTLKLLTKKVCPNDRAFCNGEVFCRKEERCFTQPGGGDGLTPLHFCAELCDSSYCESNEICVAREVACINAPCPVMPSCIQKTS